MKFNETMEVLFYKTTTIKIHQHKKLIWCLIKNNSTDDCNQVHNNSNNRLLSQVHFLHSHEAQNHKFSTTKNVKSFSNIFHNQTQNIFICKITKNMCINIRNSMLIKSSFFVICHINGEPYIICVAHCQPYGGSY